MSVLIKKEEGEKSMSCMAAAGFHQDGHSWSQSLRLKNKNPDHPFSMVESCHTPNSLEDGSSGSMMEDVVQYSICTQRNYIHVMMVSLIHLQLLFFVFIFFVIPHSL